MIRVLKSNWEVAELRLPALFVTDERGNVMQDPVSGEPVARLPQVVLPKSIYTRAERMAGKVSYIQLTDDQQKRLAEDRSVQAMLRRGNYTWLPDGVTAIPLDALPDEQRRSIEITQLQQEAALLRSTLRKAGIPIPTFGGTASTVADAPPPIDAAALAATDVSVKDDPGTFGIDVPEPVGSPRPRFGSDTRVTLPGASLTPGLLPDFAGEPPLRAGETRPLRAQGRK